VQRRRLYVKTASCDNVIKNQVQTLLNSDEDDFRKHRLLLKNVSYENCNIRNLNALDEIGVSRSELKNIDYAFLRWKVRALKRKYEYVLKAGQDDSDENYRRFMFSPYRRWGTEKITAKIITAMNDFRFLRDFVQSIYIHPGMKRTELDLIWSDINQCLLDLCETEYKTLDPYFIRRETRRLHFDYDVPFDSHFFARVPTQKAYLTNAIVRKERIQYFLKLKPVSQCRKLTYYKGEERRLWEDTFVWNVE
jgi:hypothetical protein